MGLRPEDLRTGTVISRQWLLEHGMHHRHFSSDALLRVLPAHYTRSDQPADLRAIALAAQRLVGGAAVVSDETAAELFGFRLPRRLTREGGAPIHLRVEEGSAPRSTPLLTVHRRSPAPTIRHHGVTMSHPAVAMQEIAPRLSLQQLVAAVDSLVADRYGTVRRIPLVQVRALADVATGRGANRLRAAVNRARERVWSVRETEMRLMLLDRGWPEPDLNRELVDPATGIVYYIDLAYPQEQVAIEYDGADHLIDPERVKRDQRKNLVLHAQGWTVIRVYADDLHDLTDFFLRLDRAMRSGARRRLPSAP